jgi:hypothetical protein
MVRHEVKIGGAAVVEGRALSGKVSVANKRCHKNVVVLSEFRAAARLFLIA